MELTYSLSAKRLKNEHRFFTGINLGSHPNPFDYYKGMISMAIAALGILGMQGQMPSTPLTYETKAARASVVLKEIGKLANVDLQTTPEVANEVIVISVTNRPLDEVLTRVAAVTSSEWKTEGPTFRLVPSRKIQKEEENLLMASRLSETKAYIARRLKADKKMLEHIAKIEKAASSPPPGGSVAGDKTAKGDAAIQKTVNPAILLRQALTTKITAQNALLFTHLLQTFRLETIAGFPANSRIVYSTNPTQMQRPFDDSAIAIIDDFISDHNQMIEDFTSSYQKLVSSTKVLSPPTGNRRGQIPIGKVAKAILVLNPSDWQPSSDVLPASELVMYDAAGKVAWKGMDTRGPYMNDMDQVAEPNQPVEETHSPAISLSKDSRELDLALQSVDNDDTRLEISPELKAKVFRPDQFDPLSFAPSEFVMAYAANKHKQLVADLPDDWFSTVSGTAEGTGQTIDFVDSQLHDGDDIRLTPDADYALIKPREPTSSRENRVNRFELAKLLKCVDEKGIPSLDDFENYALKSPDPSTSSLEQNIISAFVPGFGEQSNDASGWDMLRLHASLGPEARSNLSTGGRLLLGDLSNEQRGLVEHMVYGPSEAADIDNPSNPIPPNYPWFLVGSKYLNSNDYRQEPTELNPNGLPRDGYIDLRVSTGPFGLSNSTSSNFANGFIAGPEEFAMSRITTEMSKADDAGTAEGVFRFGKRITYLFSIHIAQGVAIHQTLKDHSISKTAAKVLASHLPPDMEKAVDDIVALIKSDPTFNGMFVAGAQAAGGARTIHP